MVHHLSEWEARLQATIQPSTSIPAARSSSWNESCFNLPDLLICIMHIDNMKLAAFVSISLLNKASSSTEEGVVGSVLDSSTVNRIVSSRLTVQVCMCVRYICIMCSVILLDPKHLNWKCGPKSKELTTPIDSYNWGSYRSLWQSSYILVFFLVVDPSLTVPRRRIRPSRGALRYTPL